MVMVMGCERKIAKTRMRSEKGSKRVCWRNL